MLWKAEAAENRLPLEPLGSGEPKESLHRRDLSVEKYVACIFFRDSGWNYDSSLVTSSKAQSKELSQKLVRHGSLKIWPHRTPQLGPSKSLWAVTTELPIVLLRELLLAVIPKLNKGAEKEQEDVENNMSGSS